MYKIVNQVGRSVTPLPMESTAVRQVATVGVGDETTVAFAPEGRRAFVAKSKAAPISVLSLNGKTVRY